MAEYTRLPGRGGSIYRHSLWLGPDHLLSVINRGYSEDYKRFYYRDVRAIQIRLTSTYTVINAVFGALAAICVSVQLLAYFVWRWEEGAQIAFGILTALMALVFLVNLLLGRTCAVHVYTAVHSELMPALNRLRPTNRAVGEIQARVEAVQGALSGEQALEGAVAFDNASPAGAASARPEEPLEDYNGNFHWSLFSLLLFNAMLASIGSYYRAPWLQILNTFIYLGLGICMIGALIRQRRSTMGKGLRRLAWSTAFYVWFVSVLGSIAAVFVIFEKGMQHAHAGTWDIIRAMMETVPADHPLLLALSLFSAACSLVIGLAGVVLMLQHRRRRR